MTARRIIRTYLGIAASTTLAQVAFEAPTGADTAARVA